jgi:hypothetical protein
MSALSIQPPYPAFAGSDGLPLENGYIWIGTVNLNPQVNPIAVFWDSALTIPAAQPIRTLNGYPVYQGTPARFYVNAANYSLIVQDKNGKVVYSAFEAAPSFSAENVFYTPSADSLLTSDSVQDALDALSDEENGSASVGFINSGTGAVARTVQSKLRETASRADYDSDVNFFAEKGLKPNIDGAGNFDAKVTPAGEDAQIDLSDAVLTVAAGPRDAVCYAGAQSMRVFRNFATMGGFRFRGQYSKGRAPTFAMPSNKVVTSPGDLGGMTAKTDENWYAIFACANDGDAVATLKMMPFLRVGSVAGSALNLQQFKEGSVSVITQTYAWTSTNNLADTDILVISEGGGFSGRVAKITANSSSQIVVDTVGSIAVGSTLLPAPPGFDHYVYLGSFYFDTAEVRNIYDSGSLVKAKMIYTLLPDTSTGSFPYPTFTVIDCTGYICPLATAVVLDSSCTLSTASAGTYAEYFGGDEANHIVQSAFVQKDNSGNLNVVFDNIQVPFLYPQTFAYANDGSLTSTRTSGQFNITGWIEP